MKVNLERPPHAEYSLNNYPLSFGGCVVCSLSQANSMLRKPFCARSLHAFTTVAFNKKRNTRQCCNPEAASTASSNQGWAESGSAGYSLNSSVAVPAVKGQVAMETRRTERAHQGKGETVDKLLIMYYYIYLCNYLNTGITIKKRAVMKETSPAPSFLVYQ